MVLSHHAERYRISSNRINQERRRRHRNSKCRHEGLDRTGEPRTQRVGVGDIAGNLVSSLSKALEEGERERGRSGIEEEDTLGI